MSPRAKIHRQMAALHLQGLDRGFLASLGPRFLKLLYETIDADPDTHLIVDCEDERVIGFVTGGPGMGPVYQRLVRKGPRLVLALLPHIPRPRILRGVLDLMRYRRQHDAEDDVSVSLPRHELLSIVVDPTARGTGVAERLYQRLSDALRDDGAEGFRIVVGEELAPAHRFYRRMGAEPVATTSVHGGAPSTIYLQRL